MKTHNVKIKIAKLIQQLGSVKAVAVELCVSESMVYKLLKGTRKASSILYKLINLALKIKL